MLARSTECEREQIADYPSVHWWVVWCKDGFHACEINWLLGILLTNPIATVIAKRLADDSFSVTKSKSNMDLFLSAKWLPTAYIRNHEATNGLRR